MIRTHLVSKQDHDGVTACSRRSVFDSEGVVVVSNDVEVDIGLCGSHHTGGTLDSYTDVTLGGETKSSYHTDPSLPSFILHVMSSFNR